MCRNRGNIHTVVPSPDSWLAARMADLTPDLQVRLSWGLMAESFHSLQSLSVSAASMSSWASQAQTFHQPVCQRLSWLHHWSIPHVQTIGVFSPSEWGPAPQCQGAQVAHWTWWWQCLAVWHCRSVWSLPCHFAADAGGLAWRQYILLEDIVFINPCPAEPRYTLPLKKPANLDLHCLSFSVWIYVHTLD